MLNNEGRAVTEEQNAKHFVSSLRDRGYAFIKLNHLGATLNNFYNKWEQFFLSDSKFDYLFDQETQNGYYPLQAEHAKNSVMSDYKEMYHYFPNGKIPNHLSTITDNLYLQLMQVAQCALHWIDTYTPDAVYQNFSTSLLSMLDTQNRTLLRILYYPAISSVQNKVRAAQHEDISLITLIPAATAYGLQIQSHEGTWIKINPDRNLILIIVGDMLHICSKGHYQSTTHRVYHDEEELFQQKRFSTVFFVHAKAHVGLSKEYTAEEIFSKRMYEIGLRE